MFKLTPITKVACSVLRNIKEQKTSWEVFTQPFLEQGCLIESHLMKKVSNGKKSFDQIDFWSNEF